MIHSDRRRAMAEAIEQRRQERETRAAMEREAALAQETYDRAAQLEAELVVLEEIAETGAYWPTR